VILMQPLGPSAVDPDSIDFSMGLLGSVAYNAHCYNLESQGIKTDKINLIEKTFFSKLANTNDDAKGTFEELGVEIDLDGFSLRDRKKKYSPRSKEVKEILEIYSNFEFKE